MLPPPSSSVAGAALPFPVLPFTFVHLRFLPLVDGEEEKVKDQTTKEDAGVKLGIDHFNNEETDLIKTNAMTLCGKLIPCITTAAPQVIPSLENDIMVRSKTTAIVVKDFSSGLYATIFRDETIEDVKREVKLGFNQLNVFLWNIASLVLF
ncbi:hypothetical protein L1987_73001 [Smallanthus sonchifolius]|uniref:Uncharacterized protein n=1 Tax=Smallanthus sonchifolius TaxID=185202 RepID=A0ACB9B169_9ASTR|nr:hypothetical protein L1987_73001 [Smallanthus sonchifolius]